MSNDHDDTVPSEPLTDLRLDGYTHETLLELLADLAGDSDRAADVTNGETLAEFLFAVVDELKATRGLLRIVAKGRTPAWRLAARARAYLAKTEGTNEQ